MHMASEAVMVFKSLCMYVPACVCACACACVCVCLSVRARRVGWCHVVLLSCAGLCPRPVQLRQVLEGPLADVEGGVHSAQIFLANQGQATDPKIGVQGVSM